MSIINSLKYNRYRTKIETTSETTYTVIFISFIFSFICYAKNENKKKKKKEQITLVNKIKCFAVRSDRHSTHTNK